MNEKKIPKTEKKTNNVTPNDISQLVNKKLFFFQNVIQKTFIHIQKNKLLGILVISDIHNSIEILVGLNQNIDWLMQNKNSLTNEEVVEKLQNINNELSSVLKTYGTLDLEDLLFICFGNFSINQDDINVHKFDLLKKYFHPIHYKVKQSNDTTDCDNLTCKDLLSMYKQYYLKVHGIYFHIKHGDKMVVIHGVLDDIDVIFLKNQYIFDKKKLLKENIPDHDDFKGESFSNFLFSLTLKDYLIYEYHELYDKYAGYLSQVQHIKHKSLNQIIKDFISNDMYTKRLTLIQLLIKSEPCDNQYIAYLLFDLLSNDVAGSIDSHEQTIILDSFPFFVKKNFKNAMKKTIEYTDIISNFDMNKIPLEQQICLLKAPESVKEKAMVKLKEIKSKAEDSGSKARQYLEGLLKIPFGIYKKEPILYLMENIKKNFKNMCQNYGIEQFGLNIPKKESYTSLEILKYMDNILGSFSNDKMIEKIQKELFVNDKKSLLDLFKKIQEILIQNGLIGEKIKYSHLKKDELQKLIREHLDLCKKCENKDVFNTIQQIFINKDNYVCNEISNIKDDIQKINDYMIDVKKNLDFSVYGHDKAKKQIERIIAQWINGENKGTCLGFQGPSGVGKTSLAKILSRCLKDENGENRSFAIIQMGGDGNASTLLGHSYTYVGSTWGAITQILMDKKCMNPIILFDEVDKISRTEQGKEITGILTHLLDPTQNDSFQDKYFNGIDLDLSKALFILSYNDPNLIDKILLDRVHQIKFDSLSVEDKIVISKKHLLPEICKKVGLEDVVIFQEDTIKYIIEHYTLESGVRKLKETLFEIIGEINLDILKTDINNFELPIIIRVEDVKTKYLKEKREMRNQLIHIENKIGVINCLWCNAYEIGGILSASAKFYPTNNFLQLKLTGLLDKMMEESFQLSFTIAFDLTSEERKKEIKQKYDGEQKYGIHLHMGDGSIEKSGTSAGIAITLLMYSLLNDKKIKHDYAVTGEACDLNGKVGEIGGLKTKIIYGIKAGVKHFIYPTENQRDFNDFMKKYENNDLIKGVSFYAVSNIQEAIDLIIEK